MKKTVFILLGLLALLSSCSPKYANKAEKVVAAMHDPSSKYVVVVAHRGDWRNYPENSIPAIESAISMGVDIVELDLKLTKDSVLVLSHDDTANRTTTGKGLISTMTLDSLKGFNLRYVNGVKSKYKMPTLKEALEVCKDRISVNIDQGYQFYDLVLAITEELGVTDQILIKGKKMLSEVKEKTGEHEHNIMYMPIIDIQTTRGAELFRQYMEAGEVPLAYEVCFSKLDDVAEDCCRRVVESGSKLWINTLWPSLNGGYDDNAAFESGDPDSVYGVLLGLGTSIIQTDRPEMLIKYLEKKGRRK
jgi:glycerophosphoryl diester phosphodiesterase